jgi:hypothetical protein
METETEGGTTGPGAEKQDQQHALLRGLMMELMRGERAAIRQPRRDAQRFGKAPPAQALRAVAEHAEKNLPTLREVALRHDLAPGRLMVIAGSLLAMARHRISDRIVETERSYRDTLLDLRHGLDVMKLLRRIADASGLVELGGFCTSWLEEREPLVERVEGAMSWFASHPRRATEMNHLRLPRVRDLPRLVKRLRGAQQHGPARNESKAHA